MANNAKGPFLLCRSAIPALPRPGGAIVLLASFAGHVGLAEYSAYSAVRMLRQSLALELAAEGITVDAIAPAYVESAMGRQALESIAAGAGISVDEAQAKRDSVLPLRRQPTAPRSRRRDAVPRLGVLCDRGVPGHQRRRHPPVISPEPREGS